MRKCLIAQDSLVRNFPNPVKPNTIFPNPKSWLYPQNLFVLYFFIHSCYRSNCGRCRSCL